MLFWIVEVHAEGKQIKYGLLCIQQEWLTLVWKLVEYNFNYLTYLCKDVRCKRSKQTVNGSQDRYTIPSCWNNLLRDKQIICLHQADYMRRNWVLIKVLSMKQTIYQKLRNSNGNTFIFSSLDCCFRRSKFNKTRTPRSLSHSISVPSLLPSPL